MNAARVVPGRPVQTGTAAAQKIIGLIVECLETAAALDGPTVRGELDGASPYLAQLVNAGHLRDHELVLVAGKLRLSMTCPLGANALAAEEDLTPARGAANAEAWRLHIPDPPPYDELLRNLCDRSEHVTTEPPPEAAQSATAASRSIVDQAAFQRAAREQP